MRLTGIPENSAFAASPAHAGPKISAHTACAPRLSSVFAARANSVSAAFARFENYGYVDFGDAAVEQYFPHVFSFPPICGKWREFRHFKRAPFVYIKTGRKKSVNLLYSNCSFLLQTTPFLLFGRRKNMKRGPRRGPLLQEYFLLSPPAPCG